MKTLRSSLCSRFDEFDRKLGANLSQLKQADYPQNMDTCLFTKCQLKSINGYDFCYQHIDLFNRNSKNKYKVCDWIEENGEKCNQLTLLTNKTNSNLGLNTNSDKKLEEKCYCFTHAALDKLNKKRHEQQQQEKLSVGENSTSENASTEYKRLKLVKDHESGKFDLSELLFLKQTQSDAEKLKNYKKCLKKQQDANSEANREKRSLMLGNSKSVYKKLKRDKYLKTDDRINDDADSDADDDDARSRRAHAYPRQVHELVTNTNDLDLLDSDDSLDGIMLNMMNSYKLNTYRSVSSSSISADSVLNGHAQFDTNDSVQIDYDYSLNNAGVYTQDEIIRIFKCKLSKLQLLYKKQLNILNEKLIQERRTCPKMNSSTFTHSKMIKAYKSYRSLGKKEVYLKEKYDPTQINSSISIYNRLKLQHEQNTSKSTGCVYGVGQTNLCGAQLLPMSKYCRKHILHDPNQILFTQCDAELKCSVPIIESIQAKCALHLAHNILNKEELKDLKPVLCNSPHDHDDNNDEYPTMKLKSFALSKLRCTSRSNGIDTNDATSNEPPPLDSLASTSRLIRIKEEIIEDSSEPTSTCSTNGPVIIVESAAPTIKQEVIEQPAETTTDNTDVIEVNDDNRARDENYGPRSRSDSSSSSSSDSSSSSASTSSLTSTSNSSSSSSSTSSATSSSSNSTDSDSSDSSSSSEIDDDDDNDDDDESTTSQSDADSSNEHKPENEKSPNKSPLTENAQPEHCPTPENNQNSNDSASSHSPSPKADDQSTITLGSIS